MNGLQEKLGEVRGVIVPDASFKARNRQILMSQIYGSESEASVFSWAEELLMKLPMQVMKSVPQPVFAVLVLMGFLSVGGAWSVNASKETKPGDSLYVAKIVSERAQLAVTFNEKDELNLRLGFASNRVDEIDKVLEEKKESNQKDDERVSSLMTDVKAEITEVKKKIDRMNIPKKPEAEQKVAVQKEEIPVKEDIEKKADEEEDSQVIGANSGKEKRGISTSEQSRKELEVKIEKKEAERKETPRELLDRAKDSLKKEDYAETVGLLERLNTIVDKGMKSDDEDEDDRNEKGGDDDNGEVKGETASSSDK